MGTVTVAGVGKAYKRYPTRWSRLVEWVFPFAGPRHELTWVLKDVHFTILPGEAVGIVGINGAGKSTLLKIIAGTTQPTTGTVHVNGRLAALLELGMGFDPDFTGRQNVYMAGQIMGFTVAEIDGMMPAIETFAEIGEYMDQPVRVYSSGMQMRLAFSVATARRPEVLIVDEALSVGDTYFQHKSFDRIRSFRRQGTTLLIVSHDRTSIQSLCDRAVLLENGFVIKDGPPEEVMDFYNALIAEREQGNSTIRVERGDDGVAHTSSGTGEARIILAELLNANGEPVKAVNVGDTLTLSVEVIANQDLERLVLGYLIKDRLGQPIFGTNTHHLGEALANARRGSVWRYRFTFPAQLGVGSYSIALALHAGDTHVDRNYEWRDLAIVFSVLNVNRQQFVGANWMPPTVKCES
ncbi:ABC transporter ATP-binding protein [Thioalkalivibrio paradoxus]|uniref:Sugar ABC transporter ATP-binding protein n=1 Tax=Thioalkalivibrio paradoxus ARh 1 TaxID=713585 RepID=W0DNE2_9GAMM|nr:ABC transporter ATP-binding protein [Thioalkalivibrio paradoxus]AHE98513.1 sugar ABC transporter ATP-binding protein [Thioalkalivibrio paradoxus ARh 1]